VVARELREVADHQTRVVAASHVSYLTGLRHDLTELREIADAVGARLVVDASHSLGVVPVDGTLCDAVVACSYKWLLGVHGVGVFYVNSARWPDLAPPSVGWHAVVEQHDWQSRAGGYVLKSDAERFEAGDPTFIAIYVLENALAATADLDRGAIERHVLELGTEVRNGLASLDLDVLTPATPHERAGNLAFATPRDAEIEARVRGDGVIVWAGNGRVRVSVHLYNDEADVRRCLRALGGRDRG
jgi:selenocysteine lyase/cysteine desulfurase